MQLKIKDHIKFNKQLNYLFDTKHIKKKKNLNLEKKFQSINKLTYPSQNKKISVISLKKYKKKK